jgi:uncharacterized phage protein gp47/JayE
MFENKTFDSILQDMLSKVNNSFDKREGSPIYLALAPAAVELQQTYINLDALLAETFADTASRRYLIKRAAERGLAPESATKAVSRATFNMDVPIGSRFSLDNLTFVAIEKIDNYNYKLQCETAGAQGNILGRLLPIDYIAGLTTAELVEVLIPGADEEETEVFRQRYYDDLETQAFGGNQADYKQKTKELAGVGGVKVYRAWNGGGTVKLVIIDSVFNKPTVELVDAVQTEMDPVVNQGAGLGIAPIGHVVTIEAVSELIINVSSTITLASGYVWVDVETYIQDAINSYFLDLKKTWENENALVVRISQVESAILKVTGVVDVTGTTLNAGSINLILTDVQIPVLGAVTNI